MLANNNTRYASEVQVLILGYCMGDLLLDTYLWLGCLLQQRRMQDCHSQRSVMRPYTYLKQQRYASLTLCISGYINRA
jgi:hypothetical protein